MSANYYFSFYNDYRQGPRLDVYDSDDEELDEIDDESISLIAKLSFPTNEYISYIVMDMCYKHEILACREFVALESAKQFLLQAYSKTNGCTPFIVTGMTSGYKDIGDYGPEIEITFPEIKELDFDLIHKKYSGSYNVYGIVLSNDGTVYDTLCITPPS